MAVTPLIKPIQDKRGIFYNFQSALEDINITITNSETAVRFSKFALLRLPEIGVPNTLATDNKIQFQALGETPISISPDADNNINLANSFQNYALNLEALLISEPGYQRSSKLTVAERVFWKWLKEIGAIRFQDANAIEKNIANLPSDTTGFRFVEKPETLSTYNRVVKYIGEIDVVNSISSNDNAYTEVYIHVPTNVGTTPHVLFKSIEDQNYGPNRIIANTAANPLDVEYLAGRHFNDPAHPFGLSSLAFYDLDDASVTTEIKDLIGDAYSPGNWFNQPIVNSYYTDLTANYHIAKDQFIRKTKDATTIEYQRNTLDGISIDFNLANYKLASENPEIKVFSQFNDYVANRDFEFNAILVYYDTYDPNNLDQNGNPIEFETNLYGILILDKVQTSGLEFKIPTVTKYRPNPLNKTNGNSFSFKMNLKIDTSVEDTKVEKSINDYSTFSLELFTDVLTKFTQLQTTYSNKLLEINSIYQEVVNIKDLLLNSVDNQELTARISNLETSLIANQAIFSNTNDLVNMIQNTNSKIDSIISGDENITISYNIDAVRAGLGTSIDRKTPNIIKINNINQNYNLSTTPITNFYTSPTLQLSTFTNYYSHASSGIPVVLVKDHEIYIDDSKVSWTRGQVLRLVFTDEFVLGVNSLRIYTDALNKLNSGIYGKMITIFSDVDFVSSHDYNNGRPIFDIVCINPIALTFNVDKIR